MYFNRRKKKLPKFSAIIKGPKRDKRGRFFIKKAVASRVFWVLTAVFVSFFVLSYYLFFSAKFLLTNVLIEGVSADAENEIRQYFDKFSHTKRFLVFSQNSALLFPDNAFTSGVLRAVPKIKNLDTRIKLPNTLTISAEERKQYGIWCIDLSTQCFFYDESGVIYESAPNVARGALIKVIRDGRVDSAEAGDTVLDRDLLSFINNLIAALELAYQRPAYIYIKDNEEIRAGFFDGWEAYFSRSQDLIESVENLAIVLEEKIGPREPELEYIDLRLLNKIFYKYRN
jgi:cell division septal protein FtsQ